MNMVVTAVPVIAVAAPSIAAPLPTVDSSPDPIFAAIARHRLAAQRFSKVVGRMSDLQKELPPDLQRGFVFGEENEGDDPRWMECNRAYIAADDAMEDAAVDILNVRPTTYAGIVALLMYGFEHGGADSWTVPQSVASGDDDGSANETTWTEHLLLHAAESLASLTGCMVPQITKRSFEGGYEPIAEDASQERVVS